MKAAWRKHVLQFKHPSGTSRGVMREKETFFLLLTDGEKRGVGECGLLRGLSIDDRSDYQEKLSWVCQNIERGEKALVEALRDFPSIQFGIETAFRSLAADDPFVLFPSSFTRGHTNIAINGLVWMGDEGFMREQIEEKIAAGFRCIKLKIGALDFGQEVALIASIRKNFGPREIEIRVDANGAFSPGEAMEKLTVLSGFGLHSIEQPIRPRQLADMQRLCAESPLPIALDEELIGIVDDGQKRDLISTVRPQYLILKPSLIGGFSGAESWILLAEEYKVGWWMTSALESNVGLNAIAQWTFLQHNPMPQGLGTGTLYTNNIDSPLSVAHGTLHHHSRKGWDFSF